MGEVIEIAIYAVIFIVADYFFSSKNKSKNE